MEEEQRQREEPGQQALLDEEDLERAQNVLDAYNRRRSADIPSARFRRVEDIPDQLPGMPRRIKTVRRAYR